MARPAPQIEPAPEPEEDAPANLRPYLRALGTERTVDLMLELGGSEIYLASDPRPDGQVARLIGLDGVRALGAELGYGDHFRMPVNKAWLARRLKARGWTVAAIARKLLVTDSTVRRKLKGGPAGTDPRQPRLL